MKKSLKLISFLTAFLFIVQTAAAQLGSMNACSFVNPTPGPPQALLESKNGWYIPGSGTIRILVVFAEVNYTGGSDPTPPGGYAGWPAHQLPAWANQLFDWNVPIGTANGQMTRFFQEASSGTYNVIGDYLLAPTNGGIFSVNSTSGYVSPSQITSSVNAALGSNMVTGHGFTSINDFDKWTILNPGEPKITPSTEAPRKYDHVMFIVRNCRDASGGIMDAVGWASPGGYGSNMLGYDANTISFFGAYNTIPLKIARHEYSHLIFGGNNFHCGGGGWGPENYWVPLIGGWSCLSLYDGSFLTWNAWDRQRMNWKAPGNTYNPSARNSGNTAEVTGDLDALNTSHAGTYYLRDFVTTGDAIRIKLPFINPATEYNEWIWIENHKGTAVNGSPFDQWQYQSTDACVQPAASGLYMYMQIDKDIRQSTSYSDVFGGYSDYLRPVTADGYWDRTFETTQQFNNCIQWGNTYPYSRTAPNPLSGGGDQETYTIDLNSDNVLNHAEIRNNFIENQSGTYVKSLFHLGHTRHAFTYAGNKKLGIGTNPSSASMMSLVSYDFSNYGEKNIRKVYLNGISIEILNQYANGDIQLRVRFDDVDINNDVRWCADEIVLNPISSPSGYSMNIKTGKTVTLDQGTTATRMENPITYNGKQIFVSNTLMRCKASSFVNLETGSNLVVDNNSTLLLEANARLDIANGAVLRIKRGGKLDLQGSSAINIADGGKIIIEGDASGNHGRLVFNSGAIINLNGNNAVVEIGGLLDIRQNAEFTFFGSGFVKFNYTVTWPSQNIIVASGAKIKFNGSGQTDKVLEITQETLYAHGLALFTLTNGTVQLAYDSRLTIDGSMTINNAKITSTTGGYNSHRGLSTFGQGGININNTIFEYGKQGIYAINSYGGSSLIVGSSTFRNNDKGIVVIGAGINLNNCIFSDNGTGLDAQGMSFSSSITNGLIQYNNYGVKFTSASTGSLLLNTPNITGNNYSGVDYDGTTTLSASCGSITNNNPGILIRNGAKINMSPYQSPGGGNVVLINNFHTIQASCANQLLLTGGQNDLKPQAGYKAVIGDFNGYGCYQNPTTAQNKNKWKSNLTSPVNGTDYAINQCGCFPHSYPISITDNAPTSPQACSEIEFQSGGKNTGIELTYSNSSEDPFENCDECRLLNTGPFAGEKLNHVLRSAISHIKGKRKDYFRTMSELLEILNVASDNANPSEKWFTDLSYEYLKTTIGNAYKEGLLSNPSNGSCNTYVDRLMKIQDRKRAKAKKDTLYKEEFYTALDKALTQRLAGKRNVSLMDLNALLSFAKDEDLEIVNYWICLVQKEQDMLNGVLAKEYFAEAIASCNESNIYKNHDVKNTVTLSNSAVENHPVQPALGDNYPNPFNQNTIIESYIPESAFGGRIVIYNSTGLLVKIITLNNKGNNKSEINADELNSGIYIYSLFIGDERIQTKKMSIIK